MEKTKIKKIKGNEKTQKKNGTKKNKKINNENQNENQNEKMKKTILKVLKLWLKESYNTFLKCTELLLD